MAARSTTPASRRRFATVDILDSTVAGNKAARIPDSYVFGITDSTIEAPTTTVKSGDKLYFEHRIGNHHELDVGHRNDVSCVWENDSGVKFPAMGQAADNALICTLTGPNAANVTFSDSALSLTITINPLPYTPRLTPSIARAAVPLLSIVPCLRPHDRRQLWAEGGEIGIAWDNYSLATDAGYPREIPRRTRVLAS